MARKRANLSDLMNDLTYRTIYEKYRALCMNSFEWEGLPDGIEGRFIERYLFDHGVAIFFRDPAMSYMCLKADEGRQLNVYGEPLTWWANGFNYHREYNADECVIISNNINRIPTRDFITFYAYKIAEAERTMDVNIKACKTPYIIACDDNDVLTAKQIFKNIDGNVPAIFTDRGFSIESLQVLQTGVKFLGNEMTDYKNSVEGELLTFIGQNNNPVDKKERVITDEAKSNNQLIASFRELMLEARVEAAKRISELYGLPVSVRYREPVELVDNSVENVENDPEEVTDDAR